MSAGHVGFGDDCSSCHQVPFVQVRDQACTDCHVGIGPHVANAALQSEVFGEVRCASCHRDHKGLEGLAQGDAAQCVDCHRDVQAHAPGSMLADIHDFALDHPAFRLSLARADGGVDRVAQDDPALAQEASGLKFPHDVHLAPEGVKSPRGDVKLECASCHVPDSAGVRFEPIAMQAHCADCHRLDFEPAVTTRQVPHGPPREVMTTLREFYSAISLGEVPVDVVTIEGMMRRPPGKPDAGERPRAVRSARLPDLPRRVLRRGRRRRALVDRPGHRHDALAAQGTLRPRQPRQLRLRQLPHGRQVRAQQRHRHSRHRYLPDLPRRPVARAGPAGQHLRHLPRLPRGRPRQRATGIAAREG
jgi:hypothetical protein